MSTIIHCAIGHVRFSCHLLDTDQVWIHLVAVCAQLPYVTYIYIPKIVLVYICSACITSLGLDSKLEPTMSDDPQAEDGGPANTFLSDNSSPTPVRAHRHVRCKRSRTAQPLMCKKKVNLTVKSRKLHVSFDVSVISVDFMLCAHTLL